MSKICNVFLNFYEKNEILDMLLYISVDEKMIVLFFEDVFKNIEILKEKKGNCLFINIFCKENYIDGVLIVFESKDLLFCVLVELML